MEKVIMEKVNKASDIDESYLKANCRTFKASDNPKIAKDMIKLDTLNMSLNSDSPTKANSPTINKYNTRLSSKLRNKIMNLKSTDLYTPISKFENYKANLEFAAGKPSKSRATNQKSLIVSESADAKNFTNNMDIDYPLITSSKESLLNTKKEPVKPDEKLNMSMCSLNAHKRRSLKIIDNINKNLAKLHNHSKVNWSIKDVPLKLLIRPTPSVKSNEETSSYNDKIDSHSLLNK